MRDDLDLHGVQDLDPGADSEEARELAAVVALLRSLPEPEPSSDLTARVMTEVRRIESRPRVLRAIFGSRLELNAAMAAGFACIGLGLGLGVIRVHRMLKTAVPVSEYLLLTDTLFEASDGTVRARSERLEDDLPGLGPAAMHWIDLGDVPAPPPPRATRRARVRENAGVIWRSLPYLLGLRRPRVVR